MYTLMALKGGRCCGLGRPFCSHFSAVGDALHFHFAQGYRLDVMYFVSTSESDTHFSYES